MAPNGDLEGGTRRVGGDLTGRPSEVSGLHLREPLLSGVVLEGLGAFI